MTKLTIELVWRRAYISDFENERRGFRKDAFGAWIHRASYGDRTSEYGWEIDHVLPRAIGRDDALPNLRPLHWRNNVAKSDGMGRCAVTASGTANIQVPR